MRNAPRAKFEIEHGKYARVRMPIMPGTEFRLWLRDVKGVLDRRLFFDKFAEPKRGAFFSVRAVERIERFEPGVLILKIGALPYQVRLSVDGRCYVLREHRPKRPAPRRAGHDGKE